MKKEKNVKKKPRKTGTTSEKSTLLSQVLTLSTVHSLNFWKSGISSAKKINK